MQFLTRSKTNPSAPELKRHPCVCYRTSRPVEHKIPPGLWLTETERARTGGVEIDATCLGGERRDGKAGWGSEAKASFVTAAQTAEGVLLDLACLPLRRFTNAAMEDVTGAHTALPPHLGSNGLARSQTATGAGAMQRCEITGGGHESVPDERLKPVNTHIGNVKTALIGTAHAINFTKYHSCCVAEVPFRFNWRFGLRAILTHLLTALI